MIFPTPLGLGPSLRVMVSTVSVDGLRRVLRTLGAPAPPGRRAEVVSALLQLLTDPETVRGIAATAPAATTHELLTWAAGGQSTDPDNARFASYDPAASGRRRNAASWALERGLVFGEQWSYGWQMPAEISRALRGPDYRAPFAAEAPSIALLPVDPGQLGEYSAAAVARFAEVTLAVIDRVARTPLPALKTGGVGARELAKLGKAVACADDELRLVLELGAALDVLVAEAGRWVLGPAAEQWRSLAPADRVGAVLAAWWHLPKAATQSRADDGKPQPALKPLSCPGCLAARQNLIQTMAELADDVAGNPWQLAERALWCQPFVHVLAEEAATPFASIVREATALGMVAAGALTPLGRALAAGELGTMRELLTAALPPANDQALFGADLTVVVAGAPTARVSRLLDAAADRESRGGATVWRFTAGSVRRALDEGQTAAQLEHALAEIATAELPQPLRYLIGDVGRRHGAMRVAAATSVIRSEDEALLRLVVADRALRKLGLRLVAPTVLTAEVSADTVLSALRAAGYLPMPEVSDLVDAGVTHHAAPANGAAVQLGRPRASSAPADPAVLAAQLHGRVGVPSTVSRTERQLGGFAGWLSASEVRILAYAVDQGGSVGIHYQSQSGSVTSRVITAPELQGDAILAWCELRAAERWFRVDRIRSVTPAG